MEGLSQKIGACKAVLFDLFHTLTGLDADDTGLPHTAQLLGVDRQLWTEQIFSKTRPRLAGEVCDPVLIIQQMAHALDPSIPLHLIRQAAANRVRKFERTLALIPPESVSTLTQLRTMGKRIGLVSNADVTEIAGWSQSPLAPLFDAVVFSCEVAMVKPEPGIYRECLQRLQVVPSEALFVGDGASQELRGAHDVGLTTVMFTGVAGVLYPDAIPQRQKDADFVIDSLRLLVAAV